MDEQNVDFAKAVPNSHKYRDEINSIDADSNKIVEGTVTIQKKSPARKFLDLFIMEDAKSIKDYIIYDILIPSLKDTTIDVIEMLFWGDKRGSSSSGLPRRKSGGTPSVSYYNYSKPSYMDNRRPSVDSNRNGIDLGDILFETRGDAEKARDALLEDIANYEAVTVARLCQVSGIPMMWTDDKWGWYDLRGADIRRRHTRDGVRYALCLPKPTVID